MKFYYIYKLNKCICTVFSSDLIQCAAHRASLSFLCSDFFFIINVNHVQFVLPEAAWAVETVDEPEGCE